VSPEQVTGQEVAQLNVSWMMMMNYILTYTVWNYSEVFPNNVIFFVFCSVDSGRIILAAVFLYAFIN
jgi:hypothetical protein